jgi:spermidine synthase
MKGVPETLVFPIRGEKLSVNVQVKECIFHLRTKFQEIDIYDSEVFGRILLLDGHIQLTEFDEHAYHESLVQIPLMALDAPKAALVVGGGDGAVVRELSRSPSLEVIDMVEIDEGVISAVREHMPSLPDGAFDDPRVHVHVADAFPYVKGTRKRYDLIVVDSTDTYEGEEGALSEMLFTHEFYSDCKTALAEEGIVVTQADNLVFCPYSLASIQQLFHSVFPKTGSYQALVPSFGGFSGFAWGSKGAGMKTNFEASSSFRYLNEETYNLAFTSLRF